MVRSNRGRDTGRDMNQLILQVLMYTEGECVLHDNVRFIDNWAGDSGGAVCPTPPSGDSNMNSLMNNIHSLMNRIDINS